MWEENVGWMERIHEGGGPGKRRVGGGRILRSFIYFSTRLCLNVKALKIVAGEMQEKRQKIALLGGFP